jgi:hypothetical protein
MFCSVLPPPPRYPAAAYPGAAGGGPLIETNNILTHPTGPEHQLVVGEGSSPIDRIDVLNSFLMSLS